VGGWDAARPGRAGPGGSASTNLSNLAFGTYTVTAEYAGDGNFCGTTNTMATNLIVNTPHAGPDTITRSAPTEPK